MSGVLPADGSGEDGCDMDRDYLQRDRKSNPETITYTLSKKLRLIVYVPNKTSFCQPLCILLLVPNTVCSLIGKARLVHMIGPPIHILGATLKADPYVSHVLFSPNSHALVTFNQFSAELENTSSFSENDLSLILSSVLPSTVANVVSAPVVHELMQMSSCPSVLLLQPFDCRITDSLMNVKKFKDLFSLEACGSVPDLRISRFLGFGFLECDDSRGFRVSPQMFRLSSKFKALVGDETSLNLITSTNKTPSSCSTSPILLIAGPKSAGKSSLLRFIMNNFLTHNQIDVKNKLSVSSLAVLDCDIGQPEFTPSGLISLTLISRPLFGPPFTHHLFPDLKPVRQCFVGCITPSTAPQFYVDCLAYVFQAYNDLPEPRPPLIVNTMGWTQGLGLTLLIEQILTVKPDIIAQIQLNNEQPGVRSNLPILDSSTLRSMQGWNLQDLSDRVFKHEVVIIPSLSAATKHQPEASSKFHLGAPDHRDLTMLAYFMATLENARTSLPAHGPKSPLGHPVAHFLDCLPYRVPLARASSQSTDSASTIFEENASSPQTKDEKEDFQLAVCLMQTKSTLFDQLFHALPTDVETVFAYLNATLVALCAVPENLIEKSSKPRSCAIIPFSPVCECLGLAICRAIDPAAGILYLTTGVPEESLVKVTGILRGRVDLPHCFFLEQPISVRGCEETGPVVLPYLGPMETQGLGRTGLPARRSYPRTLHHKFHRSGSSEMFDHL